MDRHTDQTSEYQKLLRIRSELAAIEFLIKWIRFSRLRAKFNPNQPRVPRGYANGGQWTDGDGYGRATSGGYRRVEPSLGGDDQGFADAAISPRPFEKPGDGRPRPAWVSDGPAKRPAIPIYGSAPPPGPGHNGGPPLDPPPRIPPIQPPGKGAPVAVARAAARGVAAAILSAETWPIAFAFFATMEAVSWFAKSYLPYVTQYVKGPQTLQELQEAVKTPAIGTEVHHIVEQAPARREGFSEDMIEGRENRVRISYFKHLEISAWYSKINYNTPFNGVTPRSYLSSKAWDEKYEVGLTALKYFGVIKK